MTPRERMTATLNLEKPDQVPIQINWRSELMDTVKKHYGVETGREVEQILGADMNRGIGVRTDWPEYEERVNGEVSGPFGSSGPAVVRDEFTFEDHWGVVERANDAKTYLQWIDGPFSENDDLDSFDWPTEERVHLPADAADRVRRYKEQGYWVTGSSGVHPFKQSWRMRGFENFLCDYLANPAWVEAIYDRIVRYNIACCRASAEAGVDMLQYWGDVAMQSRMIVPPDQWRRLDKLAWKRIIDATREVNPDIVFFFHSDGNVTPIIGDLIEIGFDILNPLQPECVNPAIVKRNWGDRLTLDGGGSVQRTLPRGTIDDVRREVDFLMKCCAWNGGYVFRASNVVQFDCPVENVVTYYEMARDYDLDSLTGPPPTIPDPPPCMSIGTH
ncbi:MAG: uroporphyrinogen decarboxylase family protein [Planctomycetota bacterium]